MKIFNIIFLSLIISSCGLLGAGGSLSPSLDISKKVSGGGSGNQGIGEFKANLNLDKNKSKNYERSIIDSQDISTDSSATQDTNATNWGGTHTDNSSKSLKTTTKNKTSDESYTGSNIIVNKAQSIIDEIFDIVNTNITVVWSILCFYLGIRVERRKTNKKINKEK